MSTRDEVASRLAQAHYAIEPGITRIYRVVKEGADEDAADEPIKLLEVNEDTLPFGVRPVYFRPSPGLGIVYPSAIIEITPDEFERMGRGDADLGLPDSWKLGPLIDRPAAPQASTL